MPARAFEQVLAGTDFQVIKLAHPWLTVLAQNVNGHAALLVRASLAPDQVVGDGRGFTVETERNGTDDYVRINSTDSGVAPVFLKLVEHVLDRTRSAHSHAEALDALVESVDEFRRFSARRAGRLSEQEIRGLFAELVLLRTFVETGVDVDSIVSAWKGPLFRDGVGIHDFTFPDGRGIEVKSTHQPAIEIRVSSSQQLVAGELPLDLAVLPIEGVPVDSQAGIAFRAYLIDTGILVASASSSSRAKWNGVLDALGLDIDDEFYDQWRFLPGAWSRFGVTSGFPCVPTENLPKAVVKVRYSLELQYLEPYRQSFQELIEQGVA
jgi:hypothetical protein